MEMYCTGLGKSILACYCKEEVERIFDKTNIVKLSDHTITDINVLLKDLEATRKRGYAIDDREGNNDVYCIAAPIIGSEGKPIAAISVAMMYSMRTDALVEDLGTTISSYALTISRKMGYTGNTLYL